MMNKIVMDSELAEVLKEDKACFEVYLELASKLEKIEKPTKEFMVSVRDAGIHCMILAARLNIQGDSKHFKSLKQILSLGKELTGCYNACYPRDKQFQDSIYLADAIFADLCICHANSLRSLNSKKNRIK